ncbi:hypothetical protein [Lysobacter sp. Root667]|uniref:hypothetical protein n=1 Tax=Lysobacter sp. Root667 TaxID=1736581 RepID=UPI0012DF8404|nr:hypothetical protein [Lysobacter sp. Root667]
MRSEEAAAVIDALRESFQSNPSQFHFAVNVTTIGTQSIVNGGGTGINVSVSGGGPGSSTTGFSSTASSGKTNVQIAQQVANEEIQRQAQQIIKSLSDLATELRCTTPQQSNISKCISALSSTFVPALVLAAVKTVLALSGVVV